MGNQQLNLLCQDSNSYSGTGGYYYGACADSSKKIDAPLYRAAIDDLKQNAPDIIMWPPKNFDGVPPVFFEESPDPLPYDGVSGYPVSVQFNDLLFDGNITVESFILEDANGTQLDDIVLMDKDNDPNQRFTSHQFALFPTNRLEWGSAYYSELIYEYQGVQKTLQWCFSTRTLASEAERFYRVENNTTVTFNVVSGKSYAIYVVPHDTNDQLGQVSYGYNTNPPDFSYIDNNTIKITLTGNVGRYVNMTFANGQTIKLIIADNDQAIAPLHNPKSRNRNSALCTIIVFMESASYQPPHLWVRLRYDTNSLNTSIAQIARILFRDLG